MSPKTVLSAQREPQAAQAHSPAHLDDVVVVSGPRSHLIHRGISCKFAAVEPVCTAGAGSDVG
ncbi:hypothetical protein Ssi02_47470 [Sinosporangium siamense]|uniref:Uncharacterized protein n=1 Tax=Sinosporangium siamense TaxID=1367973 RepID=A0A919V8R2_9ACTN|nr:hypothetical protein Ssi02_47470 [Sinosporangium siamense]